MKARIPWANEPYVDLAARTAEAAMPMTEALQRAETFAHGKTRFETALEHCGAGSAGSVVVRD